MTEHSPRSGDESTDVRLMAGLGFVVVFLIGLAPTFGNFPVPATPPGQILEYFATHYGIVAVNEFSQALAAVAIIVFAAGLAHTFGGWAAPQLIAA